MNPSHTTQTPSVIQGDCLEIMPTLAAASVDLIVTDPPYLCRYLDRTGRGVLNDDRDDWLDPAYEQMYRLLRPNTFCVSFYGWHQADKFIHAWRRAGFRILEHMVFIKPYDSSRRYVRRRHEQAYVLAKGFPRIPTSLPSDVLDWEYTGNKHHPTQKPVNILASMIQAFSRPKDHVLDPFCGSGSTLVAAQRLDRTAQGIELDPQFVHAAQQRLSVETAPLRLVA